MGVAHIVINFRSGHQCRHRVHNNNVNGTGARQLLGNLQRLLTIVRLGDQKRVHIHAQVSGINRIQCMLRINKRSLAAGLLRLCHTVERQGGLTTGLRAVDLYDTALRQAVNTGGNVQGQRAGGDGGHIQVLVLAQAHNGTCAVLLFNLLERIFQRRLLVCCFVGFVQFLTFFIRSHIYSSVKIISLIILYIKNKINI